MMTVPNSKLDYYFQIADSLTALLVALFGGLYSAWLFVRRERREAEAAALPTSFPEVSPSSP